VCECGLSAPGAASAAILVRQSSVLKNLDVSHNTLGPEVCAIAFCGSCVYVCVCVCVCAGTSCNTQGLRCMLRPMCVCVLSVQVVCVSLVLCVHVVCASLVLRVHVVCRALVLCVHLVCVSLVLCVHVVCAALVLCEHVVCVSLV